MVPGLSQLTHFSRSALWGLWRAPFVHGAAILTLSMALFVTGLAGAAVSSLGQLLGQLSGNLELTLYLEESLPEAELSALEQKVGATVSGPVRHVTPEQALRRLSTSLGDLGTALEGLAKNPLPHTLEVDVPPQHRSAEALGQLAASLRKLPGVTGVDYGAQAVERLSSLSRALKVGGWLAFLLVAFTSVVITSATLQLAIYARREEIEIQKLVGATDFFVRAPFLLEGLAQGLLGAFFASLALWGFSVWATPHLSFALGPFLPRGTIHFEWSALVGQIFAAGAVLGLLGSSVAVGRFLRT